MAIKGLQLSHEDLDTEIEITSKALVVQNMISNITASLSREKSAIQSNMIESFARQIPDLTEVNKFCNIS